MKKKFYGALLLGSLFLAGGMVSCSDYDDDINSLTQRVDALEKTVAELQKAIEAGAVITNVQSTENGVTVTLSNGETFEVKNGANGADGADGADGVDGKPGSVVTIDEEGYWCIDGVRTEYNANPVPGQDGQDGQDGKDGCWYVPNEDGYWHKVTPQADGSTIDEPTQTRWTPEYPLVRVVYDTENGCLLISNAEGMEEGQVIAIPITSDLKSLAAIPYVLDEETKYPLVFFYNIMGVDAETGNSKLTVATSTNAKAHYRLNPANANTQDWDWAMIDRTVATVSPAQATRAAGDKSELLSVKSTVRENDELIVTLKSNESLEDLVNDGMFQEHAIAALQGTNKETAEVITSDYIKVSSRDLTKFSIITGYDEVTGVFKLPTVNQALDADFDNKAADVKMLYTGSLDLNTIVSTLAEEVEWYGNIPTLVESLVDEGELTYEFKLPAEYKLGNNETNQQDFVTLDGSVLKVNTEKWPNGTGAIGTTPIVEVYAMVNGKLIATGLMKVAIVEKDAVEKPAYVVTVDPVNIDYSDITTETVNQFTWEDMRQVYDALEMTREEFLAHYQTITITDEKGNSASIIDNNIVYLGGVGLTNHTDGSATEHTNAIEMYLDATKVASNVSGTIKITYTPDNKYNYAPVVIEFPYTVSHKHPENAFPAFNPQFVDEAQALAVIKGQMINDKWTQTVEISEHFLGLDTYEDEKLLNNHKMPVLVINNDPESDMLMNTFFDLTGDDITDQVLTLNSEIHGNELNVPVSIVEELANGERICVKSYTIRFVNPLRLTPASISLTAPFPGRLDEKNITFVVKDTEGTTIITNGTVAADNIYGIEQNDVTVTYEEGEDWSVFGVNNDTTQKLTLNDDATPSIKWENKGTALAQPVKTTYKVKVVVNGIAVMTESGNVTVTETDM